MQTAATVYKVIRPRVEEDLEEEVRVPYHHRRQSRRRVRSESSRRYREPSYSTESENEEEEEYPSDFYQRKHLRFNRRTQRI